MSENYQTVLNHLLFHKALISETEGGQRINRYLSMLNEIDQGMHVAVRDPFEKSVVAAFELVLERQMDPWEINLVPLTKLFLDKVKKDGSVNFVTAGGALLHPARLLNKQRHHELPAPVRPQRVAGVGGCDHELVPHRAGHPLQHGGLDGA